MIAKEEISSWFRSLQDDICQAIEAEDGKAKFEEDNWQRGGGGGGRTRILQHGNVIERGGVNFSEVFGVASSFLTSQLETQNKKQETTNFFATGVSIVMHPQSPMVPIIHMNVRYFESGNDKWFGGGIDLTPHYVNEEDAKHFHHALKNVCDKHHTTYYKEFKKWADEYFFITHRNETRGIGGIFFDHLRINEFSVQERFEFVKDVGNCFAPLYVSLMRKNKSLPYTDKEKQWQNIRRGRYVEFNLVYDRGTKFGLETNGRAESILMSLPPQANWNYNYQPKKGSAEEKTLTYLKKEIDWDN